MSEVILARISIFSSTGLNIGYIDEYDELRELESKVDFYDLAKRLEVGATFKFEDVLYEIKSMRVVIFNKTDTLLKINTDIVLYVETV